MSSAKSLGGLALFGVHDIWPIDHVTCSKDLIFFYKNNGSPAGYTNWFRYELLKKTGGTWVDTDVFLLKRDDKIKPFLMADQGNGTVNGGILRIPSNHPLLDACIDECNRAQDNVTWGQTGPDLITKMMHKFMLMSHLSPTYELYPINHQNWHWILNPSTKSLTEESLKHATYLHLWNEMIRRSNYDKTTPPPPGSYLESLYIENYIFNFDYSRSSIKLLNPCTEATQEPRRIREKRIAINSIIL